MNKSKSNIPFEQKHKIKTMYFKLLITYLPLAIVAIMLVTFLLSYTTSNYVSEEMDKLRRETLDSHAKVLDSRLENILDAMFKIVTSNSVNELRKMDRDITKEEVNTIFDVTKQLSITMALDPMIEDIYIYAPNVNGIITTQSKRDSVLYISAKYPNEEASKILLNIENCEQRSFFHTPNNDGNIITLVASIPLISPNPKLYLCTVLNLKEIRMSSDIILDYDEDFMILNKDRYVLFEYNKNNTIYTNDIVNKNNNISVTDSYEVPSSQLDLSYIYLATQPFFRKHLVRILLTALIIFSIIAAIVILIMFFFSKRLYKPISYILALFDNKKVIGRTENDIKLIQKNIKELISNNFQLKNYVKTIEPYIIDRILKKILMTRLNLKDKKLILRELGNRFDRDYILVCLLKIENYYALKMEYSEVIFANLKSKIALEFEKAIEGIAKTYMLIDENQIALVISYNSPKDDFRRKLYPILAEAQKQVNSTIGIKTSIVVGHDSLCPIEKDGESLIKCMQKSYDAARMLFEQLFFMETKSNFIDASSLNESPINVSSFTAEQEIEIKNHLLLGQSDLAIEKMKKIINENIVINKNHYDNTQELLKNLFMIAIESLSEINHKKTFFKPQDLLKKEYPLYDSMNDCLEDISNIYIDIGNYYINCNSKWSIKKIEVIDYIESNYTKDFGLQEIAEYFNITNGYFNSLFKEMMNTTFHDYLTDFRIKKAKDLILNEHFSLKEIAYMVGFNGYRTFVRCFQKYAFCSPSEFKKKNYKEN